MERGLLWLPLLALFIWLAWAGWNEYQKVEAYRAWAQQFQKTKYDIYAVLGQTDSDLTWGKPTRKGPINLQTFSLKDVQSIYLLIDGKQVDLRNSSAVQSLRSNPRVICLEFLPRSPAAAVHIPFTELSMAIEWGNYLQQEREKWHSDDFQP